MGSVVKAKCDCGYRREMALGGGMMNFTTLCNFPCYCDTCSDLFEANLFLQKISCPECGGTDTRPYDDDGLCSKRGSPVFSWTAQEKLGRELILTNGEYLCPKCGRFSLRFEDVGCWD